MRDGVREWGWLSGRAVPRRRRAAWEASAAGLDEGIDVFRGEELAMTADRRSIVQEGDEAGLDGDAFDPEVRAIKGVGLPQFIGVGLGESEAYLVGGLRFGPEHFVLVDQAVKGGAGHLGGGEQALLDAQAIEHGVFGGADVDLGQYGVNGFLNHLGADLSGFALVGA